MIFLTFNDPPTGVFFSQVVDVCKYVKEHLGTEAKLISIISIRGFKENRRKILKRYPAAIVLPAFPRLQNWALNLFLLYFASLLIRDRTVIARGPFATMLAFKLKKLGRVSKVIYDGRGAVAAEWKEYSVGGQLSLNDEIFDIERRVVVESDYRIAVSEKLVDYWRESFGYAGHNHVMIPCTLDVSFQKELPDAGTVNKRREELGFSPDDIALVYSGSSAGWQSFEGLDGFLNTCMAQHPALKILLLAQLDLNDLTAYAKFPDRIQKKWVSHEEVLPILTACDYGIMLREQSVTNKVAAPTKFAEYLAAGLAVIVSENLGDYSDFVVQHGCGHVIHADDYGAFRPERMDHDDKTKVRALAMKYFRKETYENQYKKLMNV